MKLHLTGKMLFEAPIVQILEAESYMCFINKHLTSIGHDKRFFLCFIAIAKNLYNVLMLKFCEVIELILELLKVKVDVTKLQFFHSNFITVFIYSLPNICCQYSSVQVDHFPCVLLILYKQEMKVLTLFCLSDGIRSRYEFTVCLLATLQ